MSPRRNRRPARVKSKSDFDNFKKREDSSGSGAKGGHARPAGPKKVVTPRKHEDDDGEQPAVRTSAGVGFRDRTGKVHHFGGRGGEKPAPGAPSSRANPLRPLPPRSARPVGKRPEKKFPEKKHSEKKYNDKRSTGGPWTQERPDRSGAIVLRATVDKNRKGFGFLIFDTAGYEDAFVPPREAERFFHGDRVEATLSARGDIFSIRVVEHRFREVVGRYTPHPAGAARGGWVVYERKKAREEIFIPKADHKLNPNDWIRAKLQFHEKGQFNVTAEIVKVYGAELPPSADLEMVAAEYNLIEAYSPEAEAEARTFKLDESAAEDPHREDLRHIPFITIDGETARDFDDAVYVERAGSGYVLWVAIADVSHYVSDGTALDKDARSRGTSVYFPERAFHMLPRALSENLCSLRPKELRLTMVARMEFDAKGERLSTELKEALIESRRRATYNEIQAEFVLHGKDPSWEYRSHFELYALLKKMRQQRGSIDFDLPEAELNVAPTGEVIHLRMRERIDAHRLIEEFMIAANEAVTEWMMEEKWPFVYRIHDEPAPQALERFQDLAATVGVSFSLEDSNNPRVLAEIVRKLEGHPAQGMLNMAMLRSMKQAVYSAAHGIHYGLASRAYTHFTSPIRRYPDLVVHRLLRMALRAKKAGKSAKRPDFRKLETELEEICEHCSYRERLASDAERESIKLKQVRAVIPHLGEEFEGKIVGLSDTGLFVQLADPYVEGLVSQESMSDDFYQFNEERMIFYGTRKKRTFRVGDKLKVRPVRADMDRRLIDFEMV